MASSVDGVASELDASIRSSYCLSMPALFARKSSLGLKNLPQSVALGALGGHQTIAR